jgi:hypothetical protein
MADTDRTGAIRPTIDSESIGSSASPPVIVDPGETLSRLVPSAASVRSSSAREDEEMPTTATIAAIPIAMPSADRKARIGRVRRPTAPTLSTSRGPSRAGRSAASFR